MTSSPASRHTPRDEFARDPLTMSMAEVRKVQPYQATKIYRCPGCNQEIAVGLSHLVIVPLDDADERRHWHSACWAYRARRRR